MVNHHIAACAPSELLQAADECLFKRPFVEIAFIGREEHAAAALARTVRALQMAKPPRQRPA
jgi:hypothetical protein